MQRITEKTMELTSLTSASEEPSVRKKTYQALKQLILNGELRPSQRLSEVAIAERLGVSRTPLREALMKLEEEGLVVGRRNVGYTVASLDLNKVRDLLRVREALDCCAAALACDSATEEDFNRIREIIGELRELATIKAKSAQQMARELELGISIHRVIAESTRNEALIRMCEQVYQQLQMALWLEVLWVDLADSAIAEHIAIANAIISRDAEAAKHATSEHVRTSLENMNKVQEMYEWRRLGIADRAG